MSCLAILACTGLTSSDSVELGIPTVDTCGTWTATATTPPKRRARELVVWVDEAPARIVAVPSGQGSVEVSVLLGSGAHTVHAALGEARSEPFDVVMPALAGQVTWRPSATPIPAGEPGPVLLEVIGPCDPALFSLSAQLGDLPLALELPVPDTGIVPLSLPALAPGKHALHVQLRAVGLPVDERTLSLAIGAPCVDEDGDGVQACDGDCDDGRPDVHPGVPDVIGDGLDNDCDGINGRDLDRDGHEAVEAGGDDCHDGDGRVFPGAVDPPDEDGDGVYAWQVLDWNCDGVAEVNPGRVDCDDGDSTIPRASEAAEPNGVDDDCNGVIDEHTVAFDDDGDGAAEVDGDCNDADPSVYPRAAETADCKDNDCDTQIDEGVARAQVDDRYEPNDTAPHTLSAARERKKVFGFRGGYKPTRERLVLTTRDATDIERFAVWTHDGALDDWHVTVDIVSMGDGMSYDVIVEGNGHTRSAVVSSPGGQVRIGGDVGQDNTGTYTIEVRPRDVRLDWCPVVVDITSG